jgi:hypothetical protein
MSIKADLRSVPCREPQASHSISCQCTWSVCYHLQLVYGGIERTENMRCSTQCATRFNRSIVELKGGGPRSVLGGPPSRFNRP